MRIMWKTLGMAFVMAGCGVTFHTCLARSGPVLDAPQEACRSHCRLCSGQTWRDHALAVLTCAAAARRMSDIHSCMQRSAGV